MKILCFGSCNIDYVYSVDRISAPGETISAKDLGLFPGGKGLNQAVALSKAGAEVYFAGAIGVDGGFLRDVLTESGADVRYLRQVPEKTGHAIIQVDQFAENSIMIYRGANGCISKEQIDLVMDAFSEGDVLLIQNEICNLSYLVNSAAARKMVIYFNPSPLNVQVKEVDFEHIHCFIVNETESIAMFGTNSPKELQIYLKSKALGQEILLTIGKRGSVYICADEIIEQSAYQVDSIDTTAAGDTYAGYYIAAVCSGQSIRNAMNVASIASAIAVSRKGASSSIPWAYEVEEILRK